MLPEVIGNGGVLDPITIDGSVGDERPGLGGEQATGHHHRHGSPAGSPARRCQLPGRSPGGTQQSSGDQPAQQPGQLLAQGPLDDLLRQSQNNLRIIAGAGGRQPIFANFIELQVMVPVDGVVQSLPAKRPAGPGRGNLHGSELHRLVRPAVGVNAQFGYGGNGMKAALHLPGACLRLAPAGAPGLVESLAAEFVEHFRGGTRRLQGQTDTEGIIKRHAEPGDQEPQQGARCRAPSRSGKPVHMLFLGTRRRGARLTVNLMPLSSPEGAPWASASP